MAESTVLVPVEFHGSTLIVTTIDGVPFVALKPICEALGLDRKAQQDRIKRHPVLSKGGVVTTLPSGGGDQQTFMLPLDKLDGWLFGVSINRVKPELRERLTQYQSECFDVLARHFGAVKPPVSNQPPASVAEYLNGSDLQNLKRLIGFCTQNFLYESSWNQGIWFYLRQVTGVPSPHQFNVEHLPVLASELLRINAISYQVQDIIRDIEAQAVKRIFRKGEAPDLVLADLKRQAEQAQLDLKDDIAKLPSYFQSEYYSLIQRTQHPASVNYGTNEKPGYFDPAKAT